MLKDSFTTTQALARTQNASIDTSNPYYTQAGGVKACAAASTHHGIRRLDAICVLLDGLQKGGKKKEKKIQDS
jgi:hypothetical protein